jgi:Carbohydrate family 9 binding domain-like
MKRSALISALFVTLVFFMANVNAQKTVPKDRLTIPHIAADFALSSLDDPTWAKGKEIVVSNYWSGEPAPVGRTFRARLLWSVTGLYVRFEANQTEPPVVSDKPDTTKKVKGLWDRDVCEIFIAPNRAVRNKYYEFEIAPTGEWIDLGIEVTPKERLTDWDYHSGMQSAVRVASDKIVMAIKLDWKALGKTPKRGDIWLGNLFRCVGAGATRGYLSWQPTKTQEPSFHVPSRFGEFEFVK